MAINTAFVLAGISASGVSGAELAWFADTYTTVPTNATTGAMRQANADGGDTLHLVSWNGTSTLAGTLLLWLTFFMSLLVFYLLTSWLPLLLNTAGYSPKAAPMITPTARSSTLPRMTKVLNSLSIASLRVFCMDAAPFA